MLAEKVETYAEFEWALNDGYDLFQGYFFARPEVVQGPRIQAFSPTCLQLLRETQKHELVFGRLTELIRGDPSITYKLLRYVNSALFARRTKIHSISQALVEMGEYNIRFWVTLATLPMLATNKPSELMKLSLVRARFCEKLALLAHFRTPQDAFLMGMFSLLDALADQSLDQVLRSLELRGEVADALLGIGRDDDFLTCSYRLVGAYEQGNWDEAERLAEKCRIPRAAVGPAYVDSTIWAEQILHLVAL
jgi:EAL and modified HD-GYP domain-containing signal transduction protein